MDLVTTLTACALALKVELFVPLGALDNCVSSMGAGAAVAPRTRSPIVDRWGAYITEAAQRFSTPEAWVRAVMHAESRGIADATSPAGAIGLMQIMPQTYAGLRARYGLGGNAYDPHDNIIAGTAYMSEMIGLFGAPNFLAAYNAGPARLEDHLQRGRPLPEETQRYLAQIGDLPTEAVSVGEAMVLQSVTASAAASNALRSDKQTTNNSASVPQMISAPTAQLPRRRQDDITNANELFVLKWSNPLATPPHSMKHPNASNGGTGFALFVPIGRAAMPLSTNIPSKEGE
jgi:SLT domain-containing protein